MAAMTVPGSRAHRASRMRAKRPKAMKLETCPRLRLVVENKLAVVVVTSPDLPVARDRIS